MEPDWRNTLSVTLWVLCTAVVGVLLRAQGLS